MLNIEPGGKLLVQYQQTQGATDLYPQAKIYDDAETLIATVNLTHRQNGLYTGTTSSLTARGLYSCQIIPYTDSGHITISSVDEIIDTPIYVEFPYRPAMGAATVDVDLKPIIERLDKIEKELEKKSEFNADTDKVKTDIEMPKINIRDLKDNILKEISILKDKLQGLNSLSKLDNLKELRKLNLLDNLEMLNKLDNLESMQEAIENMQKMEKRKILLMDKEEVSELLQNAPNIGTQKIIDNFQKGVENLTLLLKNTEKQISLSDRKEEIQEMIKQLMSMQNDIKTNDKMIEMLNVQDFKRKNEIRSMITAIFTDLKSIIKKIDSKSDKQSENLSEIMELNTDILSLRDLLYAKK